MKKKIKVKNIKLKKLINNLFLELLKVKKNLFLICNPFYFIVKLSNHELQKYDFFLTKLRLDNFFYFFNFLKYFYQNFYYIFKSIKNSDYKNFYNQKIFTYKKRKVLIISHLISTNVLNSNYEFYMQNIINKLNKYNISYDIIYLNNTSEDLVDFIIKKKIDKNVFSLNLSFFIELFLLFSRLYLAFCILLKIVFKFYNNFSFNLSYFFSCFHPQFRFNQIINYQLKKILTINNYNQIFFTFEGHAIDRSINFTIKTQNPKITTVGYYHPPHFDNLSSITKKVPVKKLEPDVIFVSNKVSYNFFKNKINNKTYLIKKVYNKKKIIYKDSNRCIVLPEGIYSEINIFLDFVKDVAFKFPKIDFLFKLHPVINEKKIIKLIKTLNVKNIKLIKHKIKNINNYRWCLYRGSSAFLDYVSSGSMPIYLKLDSDLQNINILKKFKKSWAKQVRYQNEFEQILKCSDNKILSNNYDNFNKMKIQNFCKNYFFPREINIDIFFKNIAISHYEK